MKIQSSYRVVGDDTDGVVGLNDVGPVRNRTVGAGVRRRGQKGNLAGKQIDFRYSLSNSASGRVSEFVGDK